MAGELMIDEQEENYKIQDLEKAEGLYACVLPINAKDFKKETVSAISQQLCNFICVAVNQTHADDADKDLQQIGAGKCCDNYVPHYRRFFDCKRVPRR